jgi:DNA ligase-associated metallophosphoesterase
MGGVEVEVAGERVALLAERALFRPSVSALYVADPHWGKAATFRAAGVPVPGGTTAEGLARLSRALERTGAARIVFLGDLFHAREGKAAKTLELLAAWREGHRHVAMTLVRGNHDRRAGDPPPQLAIEPCDPPCLASPFVLAHHPVESPAGYVLAGHVHPSVTLLGRGRQRQRLPCFHFGARVGILPAFGAFTGTADVDVAPGDRVFVVAGDEVLPVG